ncbi:hypothetical protein FA15DRAFT_382106 [Coprinopsis marcescibilis]|uniref:Uncharacterized protein n=1 Tax=Coprinopsis marcescibilis TaxID=230819 RepID=A0A5C3KWW6_COPMA|nr:hypothetical protein FA15DRAFT_382106 [Coprinopsis marcescibilis]
MASLLVPKANSPLRTASNVEFLRAMRLAVVHRRHDISGSIQTKWLTRILWHELSPMPAILFADRHEFRGLLSHAYYTHMVELGDRLDRGIYSDESSPLNRRQKTHLLAGHHSISTYWKHLRVTPPSFPKGPRCKLHKQCTAAWTMRWSVACSRPCSIAGTDVLRRLRLVEDTLRVDTLLQVCLAPECLVSALNSISQKRMEISNGLHHHFDLP